MDTTSQFRIDSIELGQKEIKKPKSSTIKPPRTADKLDCLQRSTTIPQNLNLMMEGHLHLSLAYSHLGAMQYEEDPIDQHIILHHSLYEVTIRGIGLDPVYEALLERKALWIRQVHMNFIRRYEKLNPSNDNKRDSAPMVSEIEFIRKS
ncbi:hypothetical protein [Tunicatimonas pelagia]|uniref:hypothetical protein n=1 Tax=Tunicatimonas pelagia TaxID=931531 RepID=UPI0026664165|nr:hypothetical protein [Tunicatimonas pelagia]WKN45377.1 hypothetical protein P0M28_10455 [Tunicatimonas pelagia]